MTDDLSIPPFLDRTNDAPTPDQLAEAKRRASAIGMTVKGRKKFSLGDGRRGDFATLMGQIAFAEQVASDQPMYIMLPCGFGGNIFMKDAEKTSFFIERQDDGELTIEGARYKKIHGSKTDPQTGETIQFDVLEDGSHKETSRRPKEDDDEDGDDTLAVVPAQVLTLARRVKALIEKGDRAAEKAEQFYKSAGIHIKEIKEQSEDWETIVREQCGLGRSRAYELMAIADGRTTLEKVRAGTNERKKVHRAWSESVPERMDPEQVERDRKECVALYQKVLNAEKEVGTGPNKWNAHEQAPAPDDIVDSALALIAAMDDEQLRQFNHHYKFYLLARYETAANKPWEEQPN
jgi:hypothetical protein